MPRNVILGFDTATAVLACGLQVDGDLVAAVDAPGGPQSSAQLLPLVRRMLDAAGLRPADLSAIAFGQGPGAFTGVRTAIAAAQGLALGTGAALVPIDGLMLEAEMAPGDPPVPLGGDVVVAIDARMGAVYAARYRSLGGSRWRVLQAPSVVAPDRLVPWLSPRSAPDGTVAEGPVSLVGDGWPIVRAGAAADSHAAADPVVVDRQPASGRAPSAPAEGPRAAALMRLALRAWEDGSVLTDPALAQPHYVRERVALTTAERARGERL